MILIFDFDGTIANTLPVAVGILNKLSRAFGYAKLKEEDVEKLRGLSIADMKDYFKLSWLELPLFILRLRHELFNQLKYLKPVFGMEDVLSELNHKKVVMGVVSSNDEVVVKTFLELYFPRYFSFISCGSAIFAKHKALERVIHDEQLKQEEIVYVGDEVRDVEAARKVGVKIASVTWGFQSRSLLERYSPDFILDKPKELLAFDF